MLSLFSRQDKTFAFLLQQMSAADKNYECFWTTVGGLVEIFSWQCAASYWSGWVYQRERENWRGLVLNGFRSVPSGLYKSIACKLHHGGVRFQFDRSVLCLKWIFTSSGLINFCQEFWSEHCELSQRVHLNPFGYIYAGFHCWKTGIFVLSADFFTYESLRPIRVFVFNHRSRTFMWKWTTVGHWFFTATFCQNPRHSSCSLNHNLLSFVRQCPAVTVGPVIRHN